MISLPRYKQAVGPIIAMFIALMAFSISAAMLPPLLTTIAEDIGVSYAQFGWVLMLQFLSFFLTGIVGGWIHEYFHLSNRSLILAGLLLIAILLAVESQINSYGAFLLLAIPMGVGGGMVEIFAMVLISQWEKPHSSKLTNLSQVFLGLGAIASPMITAAFLAHLISWRTIFMICSLLMFIFFIAFFMLTRHLATPATTDSSKPTSSSRSLLKDPLFFLLAGSIFIYVAYESLISCWVAVYFEVALFCPVESSALTISLYWFGLVSGRLGLILLPRHLTLWPVMFTGIMICLLMTFLAAIVRNPIWVSVFIFINGVGSGPLWPNIVAISQATRNRPRFTSGVIAFGALGVTAGSGLGAVIFNHFPTLYFFPIVGTGVVTFLVLTTLSYRICRNTQS